MCTSKEEGGQRCASHTRPAYEAFMEKIRAAGTGFGSTDMRKRVRQQFTFDEVDALNIVANYASTPTGLKHVERDLKAVSGDPQFAVFLKSGIRIGKTHAEASKETTRLIRAATQREKARQSGWRDGPGGGYEWMKPSTRLAAGRSVADLHPDIDKYWKPDDNPLRDSQGGTIKNPSPGRPVHPHEVSVGSNAELFWRCPEEGHLNRGRVNTFTARLSTGCIPICPQCHPRRAASFERLREEEYADLVGMFDGDSAAFAALSPSTQYTLFNKLGMLGGGLQHDLAMNIVHGELTLSDMMAAKNFGEVESSLRDLGDDDTLDTVNDLDISDINDNAMSTKDHVSQIMKSAGVLAAVADDPDITQVIMRENMEALWTQACQPNVNVDELVDLVANENTHSVYAQQLAATFTTELERARTTALPDGYQSERMCDGEIKHVNPTLMQRRFMLMVQDRQRVMNWSGTGAGKTTATSLAVQNSDAKETLVVCPNQVVRYWGEEFTEGYDGHVDVRFGLPTGNEPAIPDGVNRVWVVNYDKFEKDDSNTEYAQTLSHLAQRVDAVVFDEIHYAKQPDVNASSRRRSTLEKFTDEAGAANPNLVVIGASATPVVNNLQEAASVLRIVEGPDSKRFPTAPTIRNAAAAHHRIAAAGIRFRPELATGMTRVDTAVDITAALPAVKARLDAMSKKSKTGKPGPAMFERALLPEKLPAIVAAVKKSDGPTVVYTEYVAGMVEPIHTALTNTGLRVGRFTGQETAAEHEKTLKQFKKGDLDVIIGSRPIATGVDGLQNLSSNLVVASMPWTASQDDQLVGRLNRHGQKRDVIVTYVLTEAKIGKASWSWCKNNRQQRLKFKRSLADAAVDGIIPDGILDSHDAGADESLNALTALVKKAVKKEQS